MRSILAYGQHSVQLLLKSRWRQLGELRPSIPSFLTVHSGAEACEPKRAAEDGPARHARALSHDGRALDELAIG